MNVNKSTVLIALMLLLASMTPIQTLKVQAQETSSLYEYGPNTVGWINTKNIATTENKYLPLKITYPAIKPEEDSEPLTIDGPYPTILVSPGLSCGYTQYSPLAEMLSSWGYCVILVGSASNAYDPERAYDLSDTLEWLLEQNTNASFMLTQLFDESRFGVMGHSMGGNAAIFSAINETMFKVLVPISPYVPTEKERSTYYSGIKLTYEILPEINVPVLIVLGSNDDPGNLVCAPLMYDEINSPRFLIHTSGDDHTSVRNDSISFKYIVLFLKVYLSGEEEYSSYLYGEHAQQDVDEGSIELLYDISEGTGEETQEPVEEVTTHQSETEVEDETGGGIPSFPLMSVGVAILLISLILYMKQRQSNLLFTPHTVK